MILTPVTPSTPESPVDITIASAEQNFSFTECQELAKAVQQCSQSLVEGTWSDIPDVRGRRVGFIPADFESAKTFLRNSVRIPPDTCRKISRSVSDTPVTSRTNLSVEMGVCHGCHGPMGQGQHQGSAPGKRLCSFLHSALCKGGIVEDESWNSCPPNYVYQATVPTSGFETTMDTADFQPPSSRQAGPAFSTPALSPHTLLFTPQDRHHQPQPSAPPFPPEEPVGQQQQGLQSHQLSSEPFSAGRVGVIRERVPGMVHLHHDHDGDRAAMSQSHGLAQPTFRDIPDDIQRQIDAHRAQNQAQNLVNDIPQDVPNITHLRADHELRGDVEDHMGGYRQRIPSLFPDQSAPAPGIRQSSYNYNAAQLQQVQGDGIRVTDGVTQQQQQQLPAMPSQRHGAQARQLGVQLVGGSQYRQLSARVSQPQVLPQYQHQSVGRSRPQVPAQYQQQQEGDTHCYEWVTDISGKKILVRTPLSQHQLSPTQAPHIVQHRTDASHQAAHQPYQPGQQSAQQSRYQAPPRPQQPVFQQHAQPPPTTYRTEYRCSPVSGRQWQVKVPVSPVPMAAAHHASSRPVANQVTYKTEYRCSPTSGKVWQVQVPVMSSPPLSPPATSHRLEWRINPVNGDRYQVQVPTLSRVATAQEYQHQSNQQFLSPQTMGAHGHGHSQVHQGPSTMPEHHMFDLPPHQSFHQSHDHQ